MEHMRIRVSVVFAEPTRSIVREYEFAVPATVDDALWRAKADKGFAGVRIDETNVGVFGKVTSRLQSLNDGDRVEIYRPLAADPKTARRARAKQAASVSRFCLS